MLLFLIFFPMIASVIIFLTKPPSVRVWTLVAAIIELIISLVLVAQFNKNEGVQFITNEKWITSFGIHFYVGVDGISVLLILLTTVLFPFIVLSSFGNSYDKPSTFYGLMLMMQAALVGVFVALDGFLFYLFWEMALIPIYFICLIWGEEGRGKITLKFFIYTLAGSLFMLVGLVYLYYHTPDIHSFEITSLYGAGRSLSESQQGFIFWALFIAFAIKMPIFPFHTWQPDTYTVAPSQGTMLLSAIMLKMGLYGMLRWLLPVVPIGVQTWGYTAIVLSVVGIIYASCIAIVQKDFKRLIAYSSIAHVGLISAGLLTLTKTGIQGALIQMLSHGIIVFALFYVIEIITQRTKTRTLTALGGIRNVAPVFTAVFLIVMLGSIALPFTSGFVGEFLLLSSVFQYQPVLGALAGTTIILGAVYMLRAFQKTMLGEVNEVTSLFEDLTTQEKLVLYPIVILIIFIGIYPTPLLEISEVSVSDLVQLFSEYTNR
jgi:NADH-quinone oxidoreductase subunit M